MANVSNNKSAKLSKTASKFPSRAAFNKCVTMYYNSAQRQLVFPPLTPAECPGDSVNPASSHHNIPGYAV
jgi:hypothetical protein